LEILGQQFDEVGGKKANHAPVPLQSPHPPRAISRVEAFYQVAFNESEVAFRLEVGWLGTPKKQTCGLPSSLTSPPHE
jgi:hypothetical protein